VYREEEGRSCPGLVMPGLGGEELSRPRYAGAERREEKGGVL